MIQLYHVDKRYPNGVEALRDVSLRVREGEFAFLTGPSGAGKTTLLRLLLVLERVTDGQILIGGRNVHVLRDASVPYLRRNIGVVFQDFRLVPTRNVFDNVAIALEILALSRAEIERRVRQLLEQLGLEDRLTALPHELSGGEQQRVAIARALVNEPAILLADEPTGNLDPRLSAEIMSLLHEVNRRGATVLVATHDPELVLGSGQRTLMLDRGRLIDELDGDALPTYSGAAASTTAPTAGAVAMRPPSPGAGAGAGRTSQPVRPRRPSPAVDPLSMTAPAAPPADDVVLDAGDPLAEPGAAAGDEDKP
jgi:cell division transport system ATP-binding protein